MSHNVTRDDTFHASIPTPDVGDATYPAVVSDAIDKCADSLTHVQNTLSGNYTGTALDQLTIGDNSPQQFVFIPPDARIPNTVGTSSAFRALATPLLQNFRWLKQRLPGFKSGTHVLYYQPIITDGSVNVTPRWRTTLTAAGPVALQVDNTSAGNMSLALPNLPTAGTIITVNARIKGDPNSTHAGLPANRPSFSLNRYTPNASGYGVTVVGTATDAPADLTAYRADHTFGLTGLTEDLSQPNFFYDIKFVGEYGANSETLALYVRGIEVWVSGGTL